ncbi:ATP-binding protein [Ancylobacter mangrovi]|uniref:ATP-binding protein n=1 Tax=Ancylobacter mangrovi TaxID=2972472 RepID=UPI00216231ED|nr:ATP-binding protein [Ancylobacter mangrovi]MCS0505194.1 sensor histidine kinase N-terminal domain-containing protein [Ancylobacter mangrovi]
MISLRRRLFLVLIAATSLIWLCAVVWIYLSSRSELEHVLDTRLREAARMVHSLVAGGNLAAADAVPVADTEYERQLSCQIWSLDGRLLARSSSAPEEALSGPAQGFGWRLVNGEDWRVYTLLDQVKGVRVVVGDRVGLRARLVRDLITGVLAPAVLVAPLLAVLIWVSLARGLEPLARMAKEIAGRDGEDMCPVAAGDAPSEVRPLLDALNSLFGKVEAARKHERDVTAFAAHELRTPLAGLRTQAQVALAATDADMRTDALRQIMMSVDRSARLVRQLLALAKLEAAPVGKSTAEQMTVGGMLRDIAEQFSAAAGIDVHIEPALEGWSVCADRECLYLVLRNLHENALEHMPAGGRVTWRRLPEGLCIEDEGPGIPEEELTRVTERFFRGRMKSASGIGLGLTIASMAATRIGAQLVLANRTDRKGLLARLIFRQSERALL